MKTKTKIKLEIADNWKYIITGNNWKYPHLVIFSLFLTE